MADPTIDLAALPAAVRALYVSKRVDPDALRARLATVASVTTGLAPGQARAVCRALSPRDPSRPLELATGLLAEPYPCLTDPAVRIRSGFYGPIERMAAAAGAAIDFLPADFNGWDRLAERDRPEVVAAMVSPPDADGFCSFGVHSGSITAAFEAAARDPGRLAIAEVNPHMPRVLGLPEHGDNRVHLEAVDVVVEDATPLVTMAPPPPSDEERAMAAHVGALVRRGATLQFGIGGIPTAVAQELCAEGKGDFGIHSEMIVDGIMRLHQAGRVANQKGLFDGVSIGTFAGGSDELYRWLDRNPEVRLLPVAAVNHPPTLARLRDFVSVNGAIAIDLHGQVVADFIGGKQYSGIGGHETFVMGARQAPGGTSMVCLRSTAVVHGRTISTIVRELPAGSIVTTPRHQVQYVVTEHGSALLEGATDRERAAALRAIAHPDFRAALA